MALRNFSRWWDNDVGDDPVDRATYAPGPTTRHPVVTAVHITSSVTNNLPTNAQPASNSPPVPDPSQIEFVQPAKLFSRDSGIAPFETLFTGFKLDAVPTYNFWTKDEETNNTIARGHQDLADLPRFIQLSWTPAPDLKDPDQFKKRALQGQLVDARSQFIPLSPFGFGATQLVGHTVHGVSFTPQSLQPAHFKENALKCANGFIATGVVEAVVSVTTGSIVPPPIPSAHLFDEDDFLQDHTRWEGISFSELNSALWRRRSKTYGAQQTIAGDSLSPAGELAQAGLFDGHYGLNPYLVGTNDHTLLAANSAGPAISYFGKAASGDRTSPQSRVEELAAPLVGSPDESSDRYHDVKVKFVHTNYSGALDPSRISGITGPHQAEATIAIAQNASDLAAYAAAGFQHYAHDLVIPSDRVPDTIKPLEYVGYVIEKYEQADGAYQLSDTLYIPGRDYTVFYDSRVKYGVDYRYRIRAILRWSRPLGSGVLGPESFSPSAPGVDIDTLVPNEASYFYSEWGAAWAYAQVIDRSPPNPPDELRVRPVSEQKLVEVTFKLPDNPQRDINKMTLFRKLQDRDGNDLTGWVQLQEFKEDLHDQTRQGTRHLFAASSQHEQDDITGTKFDVHLTERIEQFVEYGPTNARFEDRGVNFYGEGSAYRYVYAAVCFTRHGEVSVLSDQLGARLNPDWKRTGEFSLDFVSCAGVSTDFDTGVFGTYPERRIRSEVIFKPNLKTAAPGVVGFAAQERVAGKPLQSAAYIARIESLDNGQHVDLPLALSVKNLPEDTQILPYAPLVAAG